MTVHAFPGDNANYVLPLALTTDGDAAKRTDDDVTSGAVTGRSTTIPIEAFAAGAIGSLAGMILRFGFDASLLSFEKVLTGAFALSLPEGSVGNCLAAQSPITLASSQFPARAESEILSDRTVQSSSIGVEPVLLADNPTSSDELRTSSEITFSTALSPDFNGDGTVGFSDFLMFAGVFGSRQGDAKYERKYDLDSDGEIGFSDFLIFGQSYGRAPPVPPRPTMVVVSPAEATISALGDTVRLAAEAFDANGQPLVVAEFSWESSAASVATVNGTGLVTAVAGGAATITAMAGEASGTTEIMVIDMAWAADFVARQHVVDVLNLGIRVDPNCTAECERTMFPGDGRRDLGGIKEVTGIDMSMTNPGQANYPEWFNEGRVANVRVVRTFADIRVAREEGDFAIMWYLQRRPATGRWQLGGDVATLRDWYDVGLRVLQIAYGAGRPDARGPDERLGYGSREGDENGVTDLGRSAIAEMNALGIVVDCSHCNKQTTLDAAAISTKPILANHANAEALTPHRRNKTDEELMAIAATGGVIGVTPIRDFIDTDGDRVTGMHDVIAHIEYIASLVGVDHVGIATDSYVDGWEPNSGYYVSADVAALDRWVRLTARLRARGWSDDDLAKLLGGNYLRVFREVLRPQ